MNKVSDSRYIGGYRIRRRSDGIKTIEMSFGEVEDKFDYVVKIKNGEVRFIPSKDFTVQHKHDWAFEGEFMCKRYICECGEVKYD